MDNKVFMYKTEAQLKEIETDFNSAILNLSDFEHQSLSKKTFPTSAFKGLKEDMKKIINHCQQVLELTKLLGE